MWKIRPILAIVLEFADEVLAGQAASAQIQGPSAMDMNEETTSRLYDLWSKIYDWMFGALLTRRQYRALEQMRLKPGDYVLDIGVGTGLMLARYPHFVTVVGMDLSEGMLRKAALKCREEDLSQSRLIRADAMQPPFAERCFDHIMISHTISVVSNPARLLQWAARLIKPGGRIVLLNHFQSSHPVIAWFEKVLNPLFIKLGWRSDLPLEDVLKAADVQVEYCFKMRLFDVWRIVVLRHKLAINLATKKHLAVASSV